MIRTVVTGVLALGVVASAQKDDPRIERDTGRQVADWEPAIPFDAHHVRLEIDIPSMDTAVMSIRETLTLEAMGHPRSRLTLRAGPLIRLSGVSVGGRQQSFTHADGELMINLDERALPGRSIQVICEYTIESPGTTGAGITWSPPKVEGSDTDRSPMIHAQGEPELSSLWFVCHDYPNDKLTSELLVTVDPAYHVCSNGRLVSRTRAEDGRRVWHWLQNTPHADYLVIFVVGRYEVVDVGGPGSARPGLPMPVYTEVGTGARARELFARTPEMIAYLEREWDEPYPWDKYAQLMVRDFAWGGMENTSATTLFEDLIDREPGSQDDLIVHELAHQWFGDLVTCRSWAHLWLNEGWATFAEALWAAHDAEDDPDTTPEGAYFGQIAGNYRSQIDNNRAREPNSQAMVSRLFTDPEQRWGPDDDVYSKGAVVLHMLRETIGAEAFRKGTRDFLDEFRYRPADTDELRRSFEKASGRSLERFFDQWVFRAGIPDLNVNLAWDDDAGELVVTVEQTQDIDVDNPAFAFDLPILLNDDVGDETTVTVRCVQRTTTARFPMADRPASGVVDPRLHVLARMRASGDLPDGLSTGIELHEDGPGH